MFQPQLRYLLAAPHQNIGHLAVGSAAAAASDNTNMVTCTVEAVGEWEKEVDSIFGSVVVLPAISVVRTLIFTRCSGLSRGGSGCVRY